MAPLCSHFACSALFRFPPTICRFWGQQKRGPTGDDLGGRTSLPQQPLLAGLAARAILLDFMGCSSRRFTLGAVFVPFSPMLMQGQLERAAEGRATRWFWGQVWGLVRPGVTHPCSRTAGSGSPVGTAVAIPMAQHSTPLHPKSSIWAKSGWMTHPGSFSSGRDCARRKGAAHTPASTKTVTGRVLPERVAAKPSTRTCSDSAEPGSSADPSEE